jgi:hypothetical protein
MTNDGDINPKWNKGITLTSMLVTLGVFLHHGLYAYAGAYLIAWISLPVIYVLFKFSISNCINRSEIFDRSFDDDSLLVFSDGKEPVKAKDFISSEIMNSNFWSVLMSTVVLYVTLLKVN